MTGLPPEATTTVDFAVGLHLVFLSHITQHVPRYSVHVLYIFIGMLKSRHLEEVILH